MDGIITEKIPVNRFFRRRVKFWFGMWVWFGIADKYNVAFEDIGEVPAEKVWTEAFLFAAEWAAFKDKKRLRVDFKQMQKSIDLMPQKQLKRITKCMLDSKIGGDTLFNVLNESSKKKQAHKS
jgi:hypothetical protein